MIDYALIGARIREERQHSRMKLEDLALALGITVGYLSQAERGLKKISLDLIGEISEYFGVDPAYFVTGTVMIADSELNKK